MTGPEHYREAEYMLARATDQLAALADGDVDAAVWDEPTRLIARAQAHATLALAAATAINDGSPGMPYADFSAWHDVAGTPEPEATP